jgi:hypothetical protein
MIDYIIFLVGAVAGAIFHAAIARFLAKRGVNLPNKP